MKENPYYTLNEFVKTKSFDTDLFLSVALEICKSLEDLHSENSLFNHLSPSKILINDKHQVKIERVASSDDLGGVTVYSAPEELLQESIETDHISDIYTLGIIFYELLTGELPYRLNDELALTHAILTQQIPSVSERSHDVPEVLSLVISKMLKNHRAERYKNITSVMKDLSQIRLALEKEGIVTDFEIDTFHSIDELSTSNALYGRTKEEEKLQYFIDSQRSDANRVVLISGKSGMGKSSLVNKLIEKNRDHFSRILSFKLDSSEHSTPYQILYKALRTQVSELIGQDEEILQGYRNKLQNLLGEQAVLLTDVIPELTFVLGIDVSTQQSNSKDIQVNLDTLLVSFMKIFLDKEKPFCIYIDDIQWADVVTLQWIKNVLLNLDNIIFFMTYRDDTAESSQHILFGNILYELSNLDVKTDELELRSLSQYDIEMLIKDITNMECAHEVARVIFERTKGNPFFVKEYLKQLYKDHSIWFDVEALEWKCDLDKIEALPISDNVFEILSNNISSLESNVRNLLCIASCMGHVFPRGLLKKVFNNDEAFDTSLNTALSSGWIAVDATYENGGRDYHFAHDKLQEAMHSFLLGNLLKKVHFKIGCHLEQVRESLDRKNLLECVNHLNIGASYVRDKNFLAKLNMEASVYAKQNGDFENALSYIKKCMELSFLNTSLENTVSMLKQRAECEHLCNHSDEAIHYYEKALELTETTFQKGEIYELLIKLYSDISEFRQAYEVGRKAAKSFGVEIPKTFIPPLFISDFLRLKWKLRNYTPKDLIALPSSDDKNFKMTIRILANVLQAAYQIRPELSVANAVIIVRLCLEHGLTKESVIGFTVFGVIFQGAILGNHDLGYEYSQFSFDMLKRFDNTTQHAEVQFVCGYFGLSWKQPASQTEQIWHRAYKNGLEIGDWFHVGCTAAGIVQSMFMRGVAFEEIFKLIKHFEKMTFGIGVKEPHGAIVSVKQALLNLTGQTEALDSFNSKEFDESAYVASLENYESEHFALYYFVNKMIVLYLHKLYDEAYEVSLKGEKFSKPSKGMLHHTDYLFYHALILAKMISNEDRNREKKYRRTIEKIKKNFIHWAEDCAENFLVRAYILEGELYRIDKNYTQALLYYDKASELADIYNKRHLAGIANSLSAVLYEDLDLNQSAKIYKEQSQRYFSKWGMNHIVATNSRGQESLEVQTLIKASEAIAQEYEFSNLLKTLIKIIMESAGAQHGYLLLQENFGLVVQASVQDDLSNIDVMQNSVYTDIDTIVHPIVNYVTRKKESIVIDDMTQNNIFDTSYVSSRLIKSVFCAPLILQGELRGVIYLENNVLPSVFTEEKVKFLQHLSGQIVISIENTMVYSRLEEKVRQRTKDLEASQEELKRLASIDPMTKLYNRRYFSEISEDILNMSKRTNNAFSVIMFDIDDFKNVNDTYGHHIGDKVIIGVADILLENTRKSDIVCRFGGEEYIILLPDTGKEGSMIIAEEIRKRVEKMVIPYDNDKELQVTISIGIAMVDLKHDTHMETAINKADNALYEAKRSGKNRVVDYADRYEEDQKYDDLD